jgi:hypothetical protein
MVVLDLSPVAGRSVLGERVHWARRRISAIPLDVFLDAVVLIQTARPMSTLATEARDMIRGASDFLESSGQAMPACCAFAGRPPQDADLLGNNRKLGLQSVCNYVR